jgi:hypothetical protein
MAEIDRLRAEVARLTDSRAAIAAGEAAGIAISTLVDIMLDSAVSIRKRLEAAEGLLGFKSPEDTAQRARLFLASIFTDPEQDVDHRLAATTALRKSQDVRIMPAIQRPAPPTPPVDREAEAEARRIEHERKRAHMERMAVEMAAEIARDMGLPAPAPLQTARDS